MLDSFPGPGLPNRMRQIAIAQALCKTQVGFRSMSREERRAQNEVWFRDLNERLEVRSLEEPGVETSFEIVCECSLEGCTTRLSIDYGEYEAVREQPTYFILAPRHRDLSVERVVSREQGYEIVEKIGVAATIAVEQDPRS